MGLYLLTGSQQFSLLSEITQSLAGRTGFVELLPFSVGELSDAELIADDLDAFLWAGFYPPIHDRDLAPNDWFAAYVTAYVERDIRQLLRVQDLDTFQRFVRLCAGRTGQLLNLSSLATACGITHNTAKAWISVLEASYLVFLLRPYHQSFNKRLVKMPKLYFYDAGLAAWLLGIRSKEQIDTHPLRGSLFETLVIADLMKSRLNQNEPTDLYFWRDSNGNEIDVIADVDGRPNPMEIKSGVTLADDAFKSIDRWRKHVGNAAGDGTLVYAGDESYTHRGTRVLTWREL